MATQTTSGLSYAFYLGDGVSTTFALGFEFLKESHVNVLVDGELQVAGSHYNITNGDVVFVEPPDGGADIRLVRITPRDFDVREVDFKSFGTITEDQMDTNQKQIWFLIQEALESDSQGNVRPSANYIGWDDLRLRWTAARDGADQRLGDLAPPEDDDEAATKGYVDDVAEWGFAGMPQHWGFEALSSTTNYTLTDGPNLNQNYLIVAVQGVLQTPGVDFFVTPGDPHSTLSFNVPLTAGQSISVQNFGRARFLNSVILGANSVGTSHLQDFSVTALKLADGSVTTPKLADLAVTEGKLADAAVTNAKLANGSVTYNKIVHALFSLPLGGTHHRFLRVNKDTGALEVVEVNVDDLPDWLNELANVRITQLAVPNTSLNVGGHRIINCGWPLAGNDVAVRGWVESLLGTGLGPKIDLLADYTLGAEDPWFTPFSGTAPAWLSDSTYLHYQVVVTMPRYSLPGGGNNFGVGVQLEQSSAWQTVALAGSSAVLGSVGVMSFRLWQPRNSGTYPQATIEWGVPLGGQAINPGAFTGIRFGLGVAATPNATPTIGGPHNVPGGARMLIYGHKALV